MEFLVQHFIQYLNYAGIEYTFEKWCGNYKIRLFNLPPEMDTDLIHATYGNEFSKRVCIPYENGKGRCLEININQDNFGGKLNAITAVMEYHIRNRTPNAHNS